MKPWLAVLLIVATAGGREGSAETAATPAPGIRVTCDRGGRAYGLQATDAPVGEIGAALGRATGCQVEIDDRLAGRRLTLDVTPRPPERLFALLVRRTSARVTVFYRLEPAAPEAVPFQGAAIFAGAPVSLEISRPVELAEALKRLNLRVEVVGGVSGCVRVSAARTPLARVLDQLVGQVGAEWHAVVRLELRRPVDSTAARDDRERAHYYDLARLTSPERQEELTDDLKTLLDLPDAQRVDALRQRASDILSMARLVQETPGEHRGNIVNCVLAIGSDYGAVLARLPREQQSQAEPLYRALADMQRALAEMH